ncbi:PsbP domain-containing protein 2 [Striga asiatica]|uniref:PsbP domain-containing protein 2 n=1 Tax=Striga asiatica TaxID=4170 RepID=A0A5A7Q640_STRAF|nr:PsbP domain-containing protein 2 [Striga asiatica]
MSLCGISLSSATHPHSNFPILQNPTTITSSLTPKNPEPPISSSNVKWREKSPFSSGRRMINLSIVGFLLSLGQPLPRFLFFSKAMASQMLELDRYTDAKEGFTVLVPSSWVKVDKAGASVLFEEAKKKANSVGVVVSPTRISSVGEFGTPQFVADKLIQAERRKESTKEAEVILVSERQSQEGLQVFEFEYKVDSTRGGPKRVFSAAFVKSKRLYLLNITHSDGLDNPLSVETEMKLEQVMHSFDATPST